MAKLKLSIDNDIEFLVLKAEAEAFGYSSEFQVKVRRSGSNDAVSTLPTPNVLDLPQDDQHEEIHPEQIEEDSE